MVPRAGAGWTAVVGAKGAGLAMTLDYKYLNCFYHWSGVGVPVATPRVALQPDPAQEW